MKKIFLFLLSFSFIFLSCSSSHPLIEDIEEIIAKSETTPSEKDSTNSNFDEENTEFYNSDILNAYKRAHQFMDINWNALSTIPTRDNHTGFPKGSHQGLPYSSVKEYNKFIGYDVSIKTFMTALNNRYSLLYTEDVKKGRSQSAYGIDYQGNNCGAYMGTVCSFFVDYVLGLDIPYVTSEYDYLCRIGVFEKIEDQSFNNIQIMDIIWEPGHANIITNVLRNSSKEIEFVVWSESTSPYVKSTKMSKLMFTNRMEKNKGIIYRYKKWGEHAEYTPSEFVSVMGEAIQEYHYNNDICTFAGDYACFREGDLIVINYEKNNYSAMELMKDDEIIATIDLPADASNHAIYLNGMNLSYGQYKARLAGGNGYSNYTYFEVLQTNVNYISEGNSKIITFNSSNATPKYIQFSLKDGTTRGKYVFTEEDLLNKSVTINPKEIYNEVYGKTKWGGDIYLKVTFQGKYGRATNQLLKTDLK